MSPLWLRIWLICVLFVFLVSLPRGLSKTSVWFCWYSPLIFLFSISSWILKIYSLLLTLDLIYSLFTSFLRQELRLLILDLSSFPLYLFITIHFPLSTAFTSLYYVKLYFLFSFCSKYFNFSWVFFFDSCVI